jgi:hypothetical protein
MASLVEKSTRLRALVGTIIHSIAFGELQVIPRGAILVNASGTIQRLLDLSSADASARFEPNVAPFEGVDEIKVT